MGAELDTYVEDREGFLRSRVYVVRQLIRRLTRQGVSVRVLQRLDISSQVEAAFIHVDLTTVPVPFSWVDRLYRRCLNGRALSIARDLYSTARLLPEDDCPEPVIVKTLLNHRGLSELAYLN